MTTLSEMEAEVLRAYRRVMRRAGEIVVQIPDPGDGFETDELRPTIMAFHVLGFALARTCGLSQEEISTGLDLARRFESWDPKKVQSDIGVESINHPPGVA